MTTLLASIASVSLLVGGIGIMNIMLVSVTERTREIGIRMSIGARKRDILTQFLMEAIVMSLLGGIIGICFGVAGSSLVSKIAGWPTFITTNSIIIAVFFSMIVGVFFGFYPARKASMLHPIDALRYE
jgi:putative ABC transport system permease protein